MKRMEAGFLQLEVVQRCHSRYVPYSQHADLRVFRFEKVETKYHGSLMEVDFVLCGWKSERLSSVQEKMY